MIEHSREFRRIKKISETNPAEGIGSWDINISQKVFYLMEVEKGRDTGVWCFEPHEEGYLMHAAMGPLCRGAKAVESGLNAMGWLFENTGCDTVIAAVPVELRHAHVIPRQAGLKFIEIRDGCRCSVMRRKDYYSKRAA